MCHAGKREPTTNPRESEGCRNVQTTFESEVCTSLSWVLHALSKASEGWLWSRPGNAGRHLSTNSKAPAHFSTSRSHSPLVPHVLHAQHTRSELAVGSLISKRESKHCVFVVQTLSDVLVGAFDSCSSGRQVLRTRQSTGFREAARYSPS